MGIYLFILAIIYAIYKLMKAKKDTIKISPLALIGYTLVNLALLCGVYFVKMSQLASGKYAAVLFFKILSYVFLPLIIVVVVAAFGRFILTQLFRLVGAEEVKDKIFQFLASLGIGFGAFFTLLMILACTKIYTALSVMGVLAIMAIVAWREMWSLAKGFVEPIIETKNHKSGSLHSMNFPLFTGEICFMALTFLLGVNLISIVRSMPIGWDDLGVYMNFPRIMAQNGEILHGVGMLSWQLLTGIGHLFNSAPQAFFINNIGGVLSAILIALSLHSLLPKEKKSFLSLPLLGALIVYAMPMIVFQQAKDMKLDPGLLFVSIIPLYMAIYLARKWKDDGLFAELHTKGLSLLTQKREVLAYGAVIGALLGVAFSIKITSVLLIFGIIGVMFYVFAGLSGYLGYFFFFIGSLALLHIENFLGMSFSSGGLGAIAIGGTLLAIALGLWAWSWIKNGKTQVLTALIISLVAGVSFVAVLSPWLVKNVVELNSAGTRIGAMSLITGAQNFKQISMSSLYSKDEITKKEASLSQDLSASGTTTNEDLGRYFGYETGLNNYARLPWNLTMQLNQAGEYTEISFVYLALIPAVLLFLPVVTPLFSIAIVAVISLAFVYFTKAGAIGAALTAFFSSILMPYGYLFILALAIGAIIFFTYGLRKHPITDTVKLVMAFLATYGALFLVCGFGIVWYGIMVYYAFVLLIVLSVESMHIETDESPKDPEEADLVDSLRLIANVTVFIISGFYFFHSALPHGFSNMQAAAFDEFKSNMFTQEESIFRGHPDYVGILSTLNINNQEKAVDMVLESASKVDNGIYASYTKIISELITNKQLTKKLTTLKDFDSLIMSTNDLSTIFGQTLDTSTQQAFRLGARALSQEVYLMLMQPPKELRNEEKIYRIGTFLTYFISNNYSRYYEDNLVTMFDTYFADSTNFDHTVERMKQVGLKYLLVDLNAATIDKNDPRHDLTRRFELLLNTMQSKKLKLVQTDSLCLQYALDKKRGTDGYLATAGVNYESYIKTATGTQVINRGAKLASCYNELLTIMEKEGASSTNYPYLQDVATYLQKQKPTSAEAVRTIMDQAVGHGWMALFEIQ